MGLSRRVNWFWVGFERIGGEGLASGIVVVMTMMLGLGFWWALGGGDRL